MTDANTRKATPVEMFFDPICPWAWMTSRWLMEVQEQRDIEVTWSLMSLAALNEGRDLPDDYATSMQHAWGPARVVAAALSQHGQDHAKALYDALGTRFHPGGRSHVEEGEAVIREALEGVGLPAELAEVAFPQGVGNNPDDEITADLRARQQRVVDLVGDEVGTPVVAVEGTAFFGPVVSPAPKGEDAVRLWDGAVLVASTPGFFEIKRSRDVGPQFD
ncbi:mycothiol-dependent nitroreductase Rv2466c family protein [Kytococcus sp. Marseille-QA3725]